MQSAVAAAMLLLLCCCCRCWLCCLLPQLGRDGLVASVQGSGEIVLTAQLLQGQPQRLGLPRCGAAPLLPGGPFHYPIKKLMPELRLHCHANSAGYWSVRRAHANRTECHGKTSGLQPTPQHTTVMHGTIRPQTPFRVPPLWRTPLVSCGHRTCRLPTSTTQACRCAAITHGGEARGP